MRSIKVLFVLLIIATLGNAQTKTQATKPANEVTAPTTDTVPEEVKIYNRAMLFGDYMVAKNALFGLITKNPERLDYIDSLARIYFALGAYPQSLLAAKIVLDKSPENLQMLELSAICQDALGNKKESLEAYEKLYPQTKNLNHAYQIAVLQFSLQRYGECNLTTEKMLADESISKQKISINVDQSNTQEVPLSAAVHNLRGVMFREMSQADKAKTEFELAVKDDANFVLAKNNLELMNKPAEPVKEEKKKK